MAYTSGILASMTLSKYRPNFSDLFKFPDDEPVQTQVEQSKLGFIAYAERMNRIDRRDRRKNE